MVTTESVIISISINHYSTSKQLQNMRKYFLIPQNTLYAENYQGLPFFTRYVHSLGLHAGPHCCYTENSSPTCMQELYSDFEPP